MDCPKCSNDPCTCTRPHAPTPDPGRTWLSPTTHVRYYLCAWSTGCNLPCRTNPDGGDQLCRWHTECARTGADARHLDQFEVWLAAMQAHDPSRSEERRVGKECRL